MNKSKSLAEKIAGILSTTPASFDPEDESEDVTSAQVIANKFEEDDNDEEEAILSKLRTQNIDLLTEADSKYAGKKGSRKNLNSDSDETDLGEDSGDDSIESEEEVENGTQDQDSNEDEESDDDDEDQDDEDDEDDESVAGSIDIEESNNFKHMNETNVSSHIKKANCVRNQMVIWENLLEVRIQLQKCLNNANKLPVYDSLKKIEKSEQEFSNKVVETKTTVSDVLDKLMNLQELLLLQYPETKKLNKEDQPNKSANGSGIGDDDDEEIPSDTEQENSESEEDQKVQQLSKHRKRKLADYEKDLDTQHKKYKPYRNSVIQKWNDKTRLAVMKSSSASHSILNQIEYNLSNNKMKLLKKSQHDRSIDEHNTEIYDDTDFYHQLLRELIEVKSADITDPVQLTRQWVQLQSLRSKMKRKIDTKATKGRKIRYDVHNKLVNFMAPIEDNRWSDEAKTELFNSLFDKGEQLSEA